MTKKTKHKQEVGDRLRIIIESTDTSLAQWSRDMKLKPQNVSNWLSGLSYPNIPFAIKLCKMHRITLDWIFRGEVAGVSVAWAEYLKSKKWEVPEA